jgi:hypothetical protein
MENKMSLAEFYGDQPPPQLLPQAPRGYSDGLSNQSGGFRDHQSFYQQGYVNDYQRSYQRDYQTRPWSGFAPPTSNGIHQYNGEQQYMGSNNGFHGGSSYGGHGQYAPSRAVYEEDDRAMNLRPPDGSNQLQQGKPMDDPYRWMDNMGRIGVGINTAGIWSTGPRFDEVQRMSGEHPVEDLPPLEPELFQPAIPDYAHHAGNYDALYERERLEMERRRESERELERRMHLQQGPPSGPGNSDFYRDDRSTWSQERPVNHEEPHRQELHWQEPRMEPQEHRRQEPSRQEPYRPPQLQNRQPPRMPSHDPFDDLPYRPRSSSDASSDKSGSDSRKKSDPFAGARPREEVLQRRTNVHGAMPPRSNPSSTSQADRPAPLPPRQMSSSSMSEVYDGRSGPRDGGPPSLPSKRTDVPRSMGMPGQQWRRGDVPFGRDREYSRRDEHKSRNGFDRPPVDFHNDRLSMSFGDSMMDQSLIGGSDSVFPGKRSLPRRDFDSDLDDMRMAGMMNNMSFNSGNRWRRDDDRD